MTSGEYRQHIYDSVTVALGSQYPRDDTGLPWALKACQLLKADGHDAILLAGSAHWNYNKRTPRWFGYRWNPNDPWNQHWATLKLPPEMHVWAGIVSQPCEFLDLTAGTWPLRMSQRGLKWTADKPPEFMWCAEDSAPNYKVEMAAIETALRLAKKLARIDTANFSAVVKQQISRLCS